MSKLFLLKIPVRPNPDHHTYWQINYGLLEMWMMGESTEDVGNRGVLIARLLRFETAGKFEVLELADDSYTKADPAQYSLEMPARTLGISFRYFPWLVIGEDIPDELKYVASAIPDDWKLGRKLGGE